MADIRIDITAQPSLKNVENEIKALIEKYNGKKISVNIDSNAVKEANAHISATEQSIKKLSSTAETGFKSGAVESKKMADGVKEVGQQTEKTGDSIGKMAAKVAQWAVATALIYAPLRQTKESLDEMKKVDTQMVAIRKVTGATKEEMAALGAEAYKTAVAMGAVASEYVGAAAEFAKAGYADQAAELGKLSLMTQTVGDVQAQIANQFLLSTDAAYKYGGSVSDLAKVLDGANEIGNRYATSVEKIADGMGIVAPLAAQAGVSVDQLTAAMGTITAVTQRSGSEAARAFRALILNLRQVKDEVLDIETGEVLDEAAIKRSEKSINALGVNIREIKDGLEQLRDPMEIIEEIASKWDTLTKTKPIAVQEFIDAVGGKMRSSQLVALIENFDVYQQMLTTYSEAAGSALSEQAIYLDSWEAKTNQLSATWTEFVAKTVHTEWIKGLLDGARFLIQSFGDLGTTLALVAVWFAAIKTEAVIAGFATLAGKLGLLATGFSSVVAVISILPAAMKVAQAESISLSAALNIVSGGAITAQIAMSALTAGLALFAVAVTGGVMAYNNWKRSQEESRQAAIDAGNALKDESTALESTKQKVVELRDALDESNLSQEESYNVRKELYSIQKSLIEQYGKEAKGIDLVTGSINDQIDTINRLSKSAYEKFYKENKRAIDDTRKFFSEVSTEKILVQGLEIKIEGAPLERLEKLNEEFDKYQAWIEKTGDSTGVYNRLLSKLSDSINELSADIETNGKVYQQYIEGLIQNDKKYSAEYGSILKARAELEKAQLGGNAEKVAKAQEALFAAMITMLDKFGDEPFVADFIESFAADFQSEFDKYKFKIAFEADISGLKASVEEVLAALPNMTDKEILQIGDVGGTEKQIAAFEHLKIVADESEMSVESLIAALVAMGLVKPTPKLPIVPIEEYRAFEEIAEELVATLSKLDSAFSAAINANKELEETGGMTAKTLKSLTDNNLLQYLEQTENGLRLNTAALEDEFEIAKDNAKAMILKAAETEKAAIAEQFLAKEAEKAKDPIEAIGDAARVAARGAIEAAGALDKATLSTAALRAQSKGEQLKLDPELRKLYNEVDARTKSSIAAIDNLSLSSSNATKDSSTAASKAVDKNLEAFNAAYKELQRLRDTTDKEQQISATEYLNRLEELYQKHFSNLKKYQDEYTKYENEVFKGRIDEFSEMLEDLQFAFGLEIDEASSEDVIAFYQRLVVDIEKELKRLEGLGYGLDDKEIQNLYDHLDKIKGKIAEVSKSAYESSASFIEREMELREYYDQLSYQDKMDFYDSLEQLARGYYEGQEDLADEFNSRLTELDKERYAATQSYLKDLQRELESAISNLQLELEVEEIQPIEIDISLKQDAINDINRQLHGLQDELESLIRPFEIDLSGVEKAISSVDRQLSNVKDTLADTIKPFEDKVKQVEKILKRLGEEIQGVKDDLADTLKPLDAEIKAYQTQIDELEKIRNLEEQRNKIEEARLAIIEKEQALLTAQQQRTVRTLVDGQFVMRADVRAVEKAEEDLAAARKKLEEEEYQAQINTLKNAQDALKEQVEFYKEQAQIQINRLEDEQKFQEKQRDNLRGIIENYKETYQVEIDRLETQKKNLEKEKQALNDRINFYKQEYQAQKDRLEQQKHVLEDEKQLLQDQLDATRARHEAINKQLNEVAKSAGTMNTIMNDLATYGAPRLQKAVANVTDILNQIGSTSLDNPYDSSGSGSPGTSGLTPGTPYTATLPSGQIVPIDSSGGITTTKGLVPGTIVYFPDSTYKIVEYGTPGSNYNPASGYSSIRLNDQGGLNYGKGAMLKGVDRPEMVLDPDTTEMVMKPITPLKNSVYFNARDAIRSVFGGKNEIQKAATMNHQYSTMNQGTTTNNNGATYNFPGGITIGAERAKTLTVAQLAQGFSTLPVKRAF